jgi:hypothetical protein
MRPGIELQSRSPAFISGARTAAEFRIQSVHTSPFRADLELMRVNRNHRGQGAGVTCSTASYSIILRGTITCRDLLSNS